MGSDDLAVLRMELVEATRLSFAACRRDSAGQTLYAYALVMANDNGECLQTQCHSEEALARRTARWPPPENAAGLWRYCPDEWWPITSESVVTGRGYDFSAIKDGLIAALDRPDEGDPNLIPEACIDALGVLDREGFFGVGAAREAVTLLVYATDGPASWWPASVRRLNPRPVLERFEAAVPWVQRQAVPGAAPDRAM